MCRYDTKLMHESFSKLGSWFKSLNSTSTLTAKDPRNWPSEGLAWLSAVDSKDPLPFKRSLVVASTSSKR